VVTVTGTPPRSVVSNRPLPEITGYRWYTGVAVGSSPRKRSSVPPRTVSGRTFARLGSALVNVSDVFEDPADSGPPPALGSV